MSPYPLVGSYPTVSPLPVGLRPIGGLVSVALSLALRRQPVRLTPALLQPGLSSGNPAVSRYAPAKLYQKES